MKNILEQIVADKLIEVEKAKQQVTIADLEKATDFGRTCYSLADSIKKTPFGIISEFKRKSPSKGIINDQVNPVEVTKAYQEAGVAAISVLTDGPYFMGHMDDVKAVRPNLSVPVLRKEFMVDEYQLWEAKAIGADVILLIAAAIDADLLKSLAKSAKELGLSVLLEVHNLKELQDTLNEYVDVVGVNNRNLKTFEVSLDTSKEIALHIPDEFVKISESGISSTEAIFDLQQHGFEGFLMGENFMKNANPGAACHDFIQTLKQATV